jgi:hypothetical protein
VIDSRFVFVGAALSLSGAYVYIRDTWRGTTEPNRVTWSLWTIEPLLAFGIMRQAHIGLSSVWTLVLGLIPLLVLAASFKNPQSVWRLGRFDIVCGVLSLFGLGVWIFASRPVVSLIAFVAADSLAALPTLRKAYLDPETETGWTFLAGALSAGIVLLTLPRWTTIGALFPVCVLVMNGAIWFLVATSWGPRHRAHARVTVLSA